MDAFRRLIKVEWWNLVLFKSVNHPDVAAAAAVHQSVQSVTEVPTPCVIEWSCIDLCDNYPVLRGEGRLLSALSVCLTPHTNVSISELSHCNVITLGGTHSMRDLSRLNWHRVFNQSCSVHYSTSSSVINYSCAISWRSHSLKIGEWFQ